MHIDPDRIVMVKRIGVRWIMPYDKINKLVKIFT